MGTLIGGDGKPSPLGRDLQRAHPRRNRIIFVVGARILFVPLCTHSEYLILGCDPRLNIRTPSGGPPPGSRTSSSDWPTREGNDPHPRGAPVA
eukprot:scaffold287_cov337-Pavlova_lutheri.AAC.229